MPNLALPADQQQALQRALIGKDTPKSERGRPTVGVLVGFQVYEGTLNSFLEPLLRGIHAAARDRECNLLLACGVGRFGGAGSISPAWPALSADTDFVPVGPWNTDGLIVVTPLLSEARSRYIQQLLAEGHPVVFVGAGENGPAVIPDNEGGIRQALAHLVEHGHRRIAFIAGHPAMLDPGDSAYRLQAYQAGVHTYSLEANHNLIAYGFHNRRDGRRAMQQILDTGAAFTALLASNDESACGAMEALQEAGRRVPEDVAVVGFDDRFEAVTRTPLLTSVHYSTFEAGARSLELLLKLLEERVAENEVVRVPVRLVIRESCGCRPGTASAMLKNFIWEEAAGLDQAAIESKIAQAMIEVVSADVQHVSPEGVGALCRRLVEAFAASLEQGETEQFWRVFERILRQVEALDDDAHAWQAGLLTLRYGSPGLLKKSLQPEADQQAEEMIDQARIMISASIRRRYVRYMVGQGELADRIGQLSNRFLATLDEVQIQEALAETLPGMGIQHVQVALFEPEGDDPVAWSTQRVGAGEASARRFPSRQFPPPGLYPPDKTFHLALVPLTLPDQVSGFVAFEAANLEQCAAIVRQLEAALKSTRLYREAAEGRRLAEEANAVKSRFLSMVSHELRTPLNLIVGLSEMLLEEQKDLQSPGLEQYRKDTEQIYASAQHLSGLIRDVLDLASTDTGRLKLTCESLDLGEMMAVAAEAGEQLARDKGLKWRAHFPAKLPRVWGDRTRLRQVVLNLVGNAVKFTEHGEVALTVEAGQGKVTIAVSDTGLGIPPEEQGVIFNEFHQSERTTARGYGGLGLGLAICKRLVELHGGEIGVRPSGEEGAGSTFYFTLPIREGHQALSEVVSRSQAVLLLAEQAGSGEQLREHLVRQGFEVEMQQLVNETADLLSRLLAAPPGAVVLDMQLASERGWEILKVLKENPATQGIPVLFYALAQEHDTGSVLEVDYLTKPVGIGNLMRALAGQGLPAAEKSEKKTVLIVDDEPGILEMHARMVQAQFSGYRVLKAGGGREALKRLQETPVDLVLLDLMMPELDGFGVLEAMRQDEGPRSIPVIVLTAQVLSEADMTRLNRGVATVLGKGMFSAKETLTHVEKALVRKQRLGGSEAQHLVRKAMAYLHAHYPEPFSRKNVARYVGVSEGYLTRCFHEEMGVTLVDYLNRYRIKQAKDLLTAGEKTVTQIAMAVGFSDSNYFGRVFRREVGMPPGAFRRRRPAA